MTVSVGCFYIQPSFLQLYRASLCLQELVEIVLILHHILQCLRRNRIHGNLCFGRHGRWRDSFLACSFHPRPKWPQGKPKRRSEGNPTSKLWGHKRPQEPMATLVLLGFQGGLAYTNLAQAHIHKEKNMLFFCSRSPSHLPEQFKRGSSSLPGHYARAFAHAPKAPVSAGPTSWQCRVRAAKPQGSIYGMTYLGSFNRCARNQPYRFWRIGWRIQWKEPGGDRETSSGPKLQVPVPTSYVKRSRRV